MLETVIIILGLAMDRLAKWLAVTAVKPLPNGDYALWPGVFHITYVENNGAAFGILQDSRIFFIAIGVAVCAAILYVLIKKRARFPLWVRASMAAVFAGSMGNLIDRIAHGYVIDLFYFKLINFAVFNVADALMVVGTIMIAVYLVFFYKETGRAGEKI
jgi:signal peptidase II